VVDLTREGVFTPDVEGHREDMFLLNRHGMDEKECSVYAERNGSLYFSDCTLKRRTSIPGNSGFRCLRSEMTSVTKMMIVGGIILKSIQLHSQSIKYLTVTDQELF
jgi:hypothetical protein